MPKTSMPYHVQDKNATSVCILRVWLRDVGIPFDLPTSSSHDLVVKTIHGPTLAVRIRNDQRICEDGVEVRAKDFTTKKDEVALAAFYYVTDAAGYSRKKPKIRDQVLVLNEQGNPRKLSYRDEEFLVAIRHNEFRRAPNPDDSVWKQYKAVMEEAVWWFIRGMTHNTSHFEICVRHGIEVADLMSYARCYVVNFCGRYETATPLNSDNERKCYEYIKQRLKYDFLPILWKKERSTIPDAETVRVALFGSSEGNMTKGDATGGNGPEPFMPDPTDVYIQAIDNPDMMAVIESTLHTQRQLKSETDSRRGRRQKTEAETQDDVVDSALDAFLKGRRVALTQLDGTIIKVDGDDGEYVSRNCKIDTSSVVVRQRSSSQMLTELLKSLPHDQMLDILSKTANDYKYDIPTRREARRRLNIHMAGCRSCKKQNKPSEQNSAMAHCPKCNTECVLDEIAQTFGYRTLKRMNASGKELLSIQRQSYCRRCRSKHAAYLSKRNKSGNPGVQIEK